MIIKLKIESAYEDFSKDKEIFDFSKYSTKSRFYDDSNKIVFGKMKDETAGVSMKEFFDWNQKYIPFCCNNKSSINDKIYLQNNGYDGLLLGYQS